MPAACPLCGAATAAELPGENSAAECTSQGKSRSPRRAGIVMHARNKTTAACHGDGSEEGAETSHGDDRDEGATACRGDGRGAGATACRGGGRESVAATRSPCTYESGRLAVSCWTRDKPTCAASGPSSNQRMRKEPRAQGTQSTSQRSTRPRGRRAANPAASDGGHTPASIRAPSCTTRQERGSWATTPTGTRAAFKRPQHWPARQMAGAGGQHHRAQKVAANPLWRWTASWAIVDGPQHGVAPRRSEHHTPDKTPLPRDPRTGHGSPTQAVWREHQPR